LRRVEKSVEITQRHCGRVASSRSNDRRSSMNGGITKLDAARVQLDCAVRMLDKEESIAVHTLAYAAYCILRDLFGESATRQVLDAFELSLEFYKVPNFLKHADRDPRPFSANILTSIPTSPSH